MESSITPKITPKNMASITKRKRKKGFVYKAEIRLQGHPCLSQTFDQLSDAQRWTEDTESILRSGGHVSGKLPDDMTFAKALDRYEVEVSNLKRPNTYVRERTSANKLRENFAGLKLREITPALVAAFRDKRMQSVGP